MTSIPLVYKRSRKLGAAPFNVTIIQVYAPTSGQDDSKVGHFYQQLRETIDQTPKKDIQVVQEEWNDKIGKDAQAHTFVDPTAMSRQLREVPDNYSLQPSTT